MIPNIEIINETELLLKDGDTDEILAKHFAFGTKIIKAKRVTSNCNIVLEDGYTFPTKESGIKKNIYCLDDNFNIKWSPELPTKLNDDFVDITWDKEIVEHEKSIESRYNPNTFVCNTWSCFALTIEYDSGKIISSIFTK